MNTYLVIPSAERDFRTGQRVLVNRSVAAATIEDFQAAVALKVSGDTTEDACITRLTAVADRLGLKDRLTALKHGTFRNGGSWASIPTSARPSVEEEDAALASLLATPGGLPY